MILSSNTFTLIYDVKQAILKPKRDRNELTTKSKTKIEPPELMVDTNITTAANSTNATTTPSNKNQTQQQQCVTGKPLTGKSQQTIIYEHQKEVSQYIPSKMQPKIFGKYFYS